jgi:hypothetical protein
MKEYHRFVREQSCLAHQIANFRGVTATEVIESMYTPQTEGDAVQTSGISDKTALIALNYRAHQDEMNRDWISFLEQKLRALTDELQFFEMALGMLSGPLPDFMRDMVIHRLKWDELERKYNICRFTVGAYRKKAISELDELYASHDKTTVEFMLQ